MYFKTTLSLLNIWGNLMFNFCFFLQLVLCILNDTQNISRDIKFVSKELPVLEVKRVCNNVYLKY